MRPFFWKKFTVKLVLKMERYKGAGVSVLGRMILALVRKQKELAMQNKQLILWRAYAAAVGSLVAVSLAIADDKTLTIASPSGEKVITLAEDPAVTISYTPTGMKIDFTNINMKVVCIEDPSETGLCRLQAYDGESFNGGGPALPQAPGDPTAAAGDSSAQLSWTAPSNNGGADITGYRIRAASNGSTSYSPVVANTGSPATSYTVTGLTNGTPYQFRVSAINSEGVGYESGASNSVTPESGSTTPVTGISTACNSLPSNVSCAFVNEGDLESSGLKYVDIPFGKILTLPFEIPSSTSASGAIQFFSFDKRDGYSLNTWFSYSAGGSAITASACTQTAAYAESTIYWTRGTPAGAECPFSADQALVYLNFSFENNTTGQLIGYDRMSVETQ